MVHSKSLSRLEILDIRGNPNLFDQSPAGGGYFGGFGVGRRGGGGGSSGLLFGANPRRVERNLHVVRALERRGVVVLLDACDLRAPACPCCR